MKTFQLNTVTFGLSAAPYLAIRCLTQLAQDEGRQFPEAAQALTRDFYVDDAITGASTLDEALSLRNELTNLLNTAGLNIRQWASNHPALLQGLAEENVNKILQLGESSTIKTLGVVWNSSDDTISYAVTTSKSIGPITKRTISSEIAKIYDPLGLLGPVIIVAKILLQKLWTMKVDWDESLPMDVHTEWREYYLTLPLLNNVVFQRKTIATGARELELHGFCDASERAYGACIYTRSIDEQGHVHIDLLIAKSKVAPLKTQSIPRLELCGALLLSSLYQTVRGALQLPIEHATFWTDSTIVLHWLQTSPHLLKTFVANRVTEIQSKTNVEDWRHVPTTDNPADLISRGQTPEEFLRSTIWHHGPKWLQKESSNWPVLEGAAPSIVPEQKTAICLATTTSLDISFLDRFSSWTKMQRVMAYCLRWKSPNKEKGALSALELKTARHTILRVLQRVYFAEEIRWLAKGQTVKGKLQQLNPFLDEDRMLRVGGRLKHSPMPFEQKYPLILPKARLTSLIIESEHRAQLHAGVQTTLYAIRRRYWPIDGRSQIWKVIKGCVICCRAQPPPTKYIMGNLPPPRVTESRPFSNVGVDYCGPFYIKEKKHRNRGKIKVYVVVFVCLAVKAVHLELASDLTSEAFIAALRRFIARRGHCTHLYSDNGSNFVGASNEFRELRELLKSVDHQNNIQTFLSERSIQWNFIPPQAPHFGGLWEAAVKSFKYHLRRVAGNELFTFENFNTLITEIEAVLNSRPLTPISSDANDPLALTPGHFLIGDSLTSLRERDFRDAPSNRLSSWQQIQQIKQHFWNRWRREYLNELTCRHKWATGSHSIKEGTIVILREDNTPPLQWPLGKVVKIHPGSDGIARAATVKIGTKVLDRSIKRLVPLPNQADNTGSAIAEAKEVYDFNGPTKERAL
ncbi:uncharacterized protein LOC144477649 [Augochlora pura]